MAKESTLQARQHAAQLARQAHETTRRQQRLHALASLACLHDVPTVELERLVDLCQLRAFLSHETIIHDGMFGQFVYFILHGTVEWHLRNKAGQAVPFGKLGVGDCFGETALFAMPVQTAHAVTLTACSVLQVPAQQLQGLLAGLPGLSHRLLTIAQQRLAQCTLARVPIFRDLAMQEQHLLLAALEAHRVEQDTVLCAQHAVGCGLYLIVKGQIAVRYDHETLLTLRDGDYAGEPALLLNEPRPTALVATGKSEVLLLPAGRFADLCAEYPTLAAALAPALEQRRRQLVEGQPHAHRWVDVAQQRGVFRGTHIFVRDATRCDPDCGRCEAACRDRHGHQRLAVNGSEVAGVHLVDACRQCQWQAECVAACPEDALHWNGAGALVVTDACTGCGDCVPACPYQAVTLVLAAPDHAHPGRFAWLEPLRKRLATPHLIPLEARPPVQRADKCDLCHGYDDMACVRACPTGALQLVPIEDIMVV